MGFVEKSIEYLEIFSKFVPVEVFVFFGALIEEVISPVPSPIVMTLGGTVAANQARTMGYLLVLTLVGAVGKIIGSWFLYVVSDKAEDILIGKFGKFIGVSHKEVESVGKYLEKGKRDFWMIFISRVVPVFPTAPVSVAAGILKLPLKNYLIASFLGYLGRNIFYLYVGYVGYESYAGLVGGLESIESIVQIVIAAVGVAVLGYFYYKRRKTNLFKKLREKLDKK